MQITLLALGAVMIATTVGSPAGAAHVYRYCASYEDRGDVTCAYDTFQQCLDTARGPGGGTCSENPAWHPEPAAPVRHRAKRRDG